MEVHLNPRIMEEESIIFVFYLDKHPMDFLCLISFFRNQVVELFGQEFEDISYCISDGVKDNYKDLKFTERNLNKYSNEIESSIDKGFQLSLYLDNVEYMSRDFKFTTTLDLQDSLDEYPPRALKIVINKKLLFDDRSEEWIKNFNQQIIHELMSMGVRIQYAFIFSMENDKHPLFFVSGTGNPALTPLEEEKCHAWRTTQKQLNNTIWDIFYGNIITKAHLKSSKTFDDIISIVGLHNVVEIDSETLCFYLPIENMGFQSQSKLKNQLLNCIRTKDNELDRG